MNVRTIAIAVALRAVPLAARSRDAGRLASTRLRCKEAVVPFGVDAAKPQAF